MDLINLEKTTKEIEGKALPEAADLANGVVANAAALFNGILQNTAVLSANLLSGIDAERLETMNDLKANVIGPLVAESQAWRAQVSRLCDILERFNLGKQ